MEKYTVSRILHSPDVKFQLISIDWTGLEKNNSTQRQNKVIIKNRISLTWAHWRVPGMDVFQKLLCLKICRSERQQQQWRGLLPNNIGGEWEEGHWWCIYQQEHWAPPEAAEMPRLQTWTSRRKMWLWDTISSDPTLSCRGASALVPLMNHHSFSWLRFQIL